jgi:predicted ferric reductase
MNTNYWSRPIAPLMGVLMFSGSVAALAILFRKVGHKCRMVGLIDGITYHKDIHVLEVIIRLKGRWSGHQAGQFAFVTFDAEEGPHPFTITSSWSSDGRMVFVIKELGDYTNTLMATLKFGDPVTVEGPYGQFNFASKKTRQIWVGGGIGITPFIARMHSLAKLPDGKTIDLFYTTALPDAAVISKLRTFAREAKVNLHVLADAKDGFLKVERICQSVAEWASCDIWFCGPTGFGQTLRRDFIAKGVRAEDFHQELFDMR